MTKALQVSGEHSAEQLRALAHGERDRRIRCRLLALAYVSEGHSAFASDKLFGMSGLQIRSWIKRYNAEGVAGLADRPRSGKPPKLNAAQCESFLARLHAGPPPELGLAAWRGKDLQHLLETEYGVRYALSGLYDLLHRLRQAPLVPRPQHPGSDPAAQAAFKKSAPRNARPNPG